MTFVVKIFYKVLDTAVKAENVARLPALAVVRQLDYQTLVKVRDLAQPRAHRVVLEVDCFKNFVVGEERNFRTRLVRPARRREVW